MNKKDKHVLIEFGERLRSVRKSKNFTQERLAFTMGIEISQISRIERGIINTTLLTLVKISETLEISPADLFKEVHE